MNKSVKSMLQKLLIVVGGVCCLFVLGAFDKHATDIHPPISIATDREALEHSSWVIVSYDGETYDWSHCFLAPDAAFPPGEIHLMDTHMWVENEHRIFYRFNTYSAADGEAIRSLIADRHCRWRCNPKTEPQCK